MSRPLLRVFLFFIAGLFQTVVLGNSVSHLVFHPNNGDVEEDVNILPVDIICCGNSSYLDCEGYCMRARWYATGILGSSFATMTTAGSYEFLPSAAANPVGSLTDPLLNGGGALGLWIDRPLGAARIEIAGRTRSVLSGNTALNIVSTGGTTPISLSTSATDAWSVTTNFWRDFDITERLGWYGGGGIGFGGFDFKTQTAPGEPIQIDGSQIVNTFAWQVGTGVNYKLTRNITFDVGYRFFSYGNAQIPLATTPTGGGTFFGESTASLTASEILFGLRIYEPFRMLTRSGK